MTAPSRVVLFVAVAALRDVTAYSVFMNHMCHGRLHESYRRRSAAGARCELPDLGEGRYSLPSTRGLEALSAEQQKAFLDAVDKFGLVELSNYGPSSAWERVRTAQPSLSPLSDEALEAAVKAYVATPTTLPDVLLKTPVGPVIGFNLLAVAFDVSVCDLPFWPETTACLEVAARKAAGG